MDLPKDEREMMRLPLGALNIDSSYQRPLKNSLLKKLAAEFDWNCFGTPAVNKRGDGTFWLMDGQQRCRAAQLRGFTVDYLVTCMVSFGLTVEEEAKVFTDLNRNRRNTEAMEHHHADLCRKVEDAVGVNESLTSFGLSLTHKKKQATATELRAVNTLRHIYRAGGRDHLDHVLRSILGAWPNEGGMRWHEHILRGMHLFLDRYGDVVDQEALHHSLTYVNQVRGVTMFGLQGLQSLAATIASSDYSSINSMQRMAEAHGKAIRMAYSCGKGKAALEAWNDAVPRSQRKNGAKERKEAA